MPDQVPPDAVRERFEQALAQTSDRVRGLIAEAVQRGDDDQGRGEGADQRPVIVGAHQQFELA